MSSLLEFLSAPVFTENSLYVLTSGEVGRSASGAVRMRRHGVRAEGKKPARYTARRNANDRAACSEV